MAKNLSIDSAASKDTHSVNIQAGNGSSRFAPPQVNLMNTDTDIDPDTNARGAMTAEDAMARLEALRGELDAVDGRLRETLRERLDCCAQIGRLKRDSAIPMMQPQRIGIVQQRAAAFAEEHGMSASFLRAFYELIITETCRIEDEIIAAKQASV